MHDDLACAKNRYMRSDDDLVTADEVAELLKVTPVTVRRWVKNGRLPAVRLAGLRALRFRFADVVALRVPVEPDEQVGA